MIRDVTELIRRLEKRDSSAIEDAINGGLGLNEFGPGDVTPLMAAAANELADFIEPLVSHGASINLQNTSGAAAIHYAAPKEKAGCLAVLARLGADVNVTEHEEGLTPLMIAAAFDNSKGVEVLLEFGADINRVSKFGFTAADYAEMKNGPGSPLADYLRSTQSRR